MAISWQYHCNIMLHVACCCCGCCCCCRCCCGCCCGCCCCCSCCTTNGIGWTYKGCPSERCKVAAKNSNNCWAYGRYICSSLVIWMFNGDLTTKLWNIRNINGDIIAKSLFIGYEIRSSTSIYLFIFTNPYGKLCSTKQREFHAIG